MGFIFNFIKRLLKLVIKLSIYFAVFVTIIVLIPNLPPNSKFTSIELTPTQPRVGPLAPNNALNNAEQKYKGKLLGPEAFQLLNGELYTSLATGEIVKISPGGHVTFVTKVGQPCTGLLQEHICGRPLGFQIDDSGKELYLADAYHGIWKVDLKTDKKQLLVSPRVEIDNRQPKMFNSIVLDKNGDFYWTDSTSDFHLKDGAISMLMDPTGRVFHYSAAKNQSKVIIDNVYFANGLALSPNKDFLVISETARFRLLKYHITGPKKGTTEVFVDGLPGTPDNIHTLPDGSGILVGLYTVFDDDHPLLIRSMAATPILRKFLARFERLIEIPFEYLNSVYPHVIFEEIVYNIGHFKSVSGMMPPMAGLLQVDWNGNIIASYLNTDRTLGHISEGIVYNGLLYTGSPHVQDFIGAIPAPPILKKAFESVKKVEVPKTESKQQAEPKIEKPKVKEVPNAAPKPKVEDKKKVEQKPKVEEKPKVQEKPKEIPKPKVDQKPIQEKKEVPVQKAKPTESVKPVEKKVEAKAPQQAPTTTPPPKPAPTPAKPAPTPAKPETPKKAPEQPKTAPKPEVKTATTPKPAEKATQPPKKKPEEPKKAPVKQETPKPPQGKPKEQIPIKEDIPADTAKPTKETLKVIRKGGVPTEIPVHNEL